MIIIATLFRKLKTVKNSVRPLSKKHRFRTPFDSQHIKESQTLEKNLDQSTFVIFFQKSEKT